MNEPIKLVLAGSLVYAAWVMWSCPCDRACECKLLPFVVATGVPLGYVLWDNQ